MRLAGGLPRLASSRSAASNCKGGGKPPLQKDWRGTRRSGGREKKKKGTIFADRARPESYENLTPELALSPAFAAWLWPARGRGWLQQPTRRCCAPWPVR